MELNWGVVSVGSGLIIVGCFLTWPKKNRILVPGILLSILMTTVIQYPGPLHLPAKYNAMNRFFGPKEAVMELQKFREPGYYLYADHLQRASIMSYYLPDHPRVHIPTNARFSQFDIWDKGEIYKGRRGLYLSRRDRLNELRQIFTSVRLIKHIVIKKGGYKTKRYYLYEVS